MLAQASREQRAVQGEEVLQVLRHWAFDNNQSQKNVMPDGVRTMPSDTLGVVGDRRIGVVMRTATSRYLSFVHMLLQ